MFPLLTVYLAYNYRKQSDKLAELYFKTIRSEQLKRYEIDNTCATYKEFFCEKGLKWHKLAYNGLKRPKMPKKHPRLTPKCHKTT